MNYFNIYKLILETINNSRPSNFQELLDLIDSSDEVSQIRKDLGDRSSIDFLQEITANLIEDGLVKGRTTGYMDGTLFDIEGLSTSGYLYLEQTKKVGVWDKIKKYAIEEGLEPTPKNISKLIARVAWD